MPYTPDAYDNTKPVGSTTPAKEAAPEFRAIKTVLIDHRDRIEAAEADIVALQAGTPFSARYAIYTSGSGNFTVPADVTKLKVTMRGPGVDGFTMRHGTSGTSSTLWSRGKLVPANGELQTYVATVTPGDVIAYNVGSNESYTVGATDSMATRVAPVSAAFGATTVNVVDSVYTGIVAGTGFVQNVHTSVPPASIATINNAAIVYDSVLSATAIKVPQALNLLEVTQIPALSPFILVEW